MFWVMRTCFTSPLEMHRMVLSGGTVFLNVSLGAIPSLASPCVGLCSAVALPGD